MDFLELVRTRRSVRSYSGQAVEQEKIELCLEAARLAPSACNAQPWRFLIFNDPGGKETLCRAACSGIYRPSRFIAAAPVIIVVLSLRGKLLSGLAGRFQGKHYPLIDIGIAAEHLILQAAELGLGTCWVGWFNGPAVKRLLHRPGSEEPIALIPLGYPAGKSAARPPRKPRDEIAEFNRI